MTDHIFALVGNPNCGKTTVFNALTGDNQHVGNWSGVTVEKRSGHYEYKGMAIEVIDLPGTYFLDVCNHQVAIDEYIARNFILSHATKWIVNIVDVSNIERNLYLTSQLLDVGLSVVVVLNRIDIAANKGIHINVSALSKQLGCPVHCVIGNKEKGIKDLKESLHNYFKNGLSIAKPLSLNNEIEAAINGLYPKICQLVSDKTTVRWTTIKLLEGEADQLQMITKSLQSTVQSSRIKLEQQFDADIDIIVADGRYTAISQIMEAIVINRDLIRHGFSERIDRILLHRLLGLPIFFGVMYLMFMFSVKIGSAFMDFFNILSGTLFVEGISHLLEQIDAPSWLIVLLANSVGGSIQTISTFIPVIVFLFLFLFLLEDSGYMVRAAFIMDRLMCALGLPGRAFVPMLVGFGCNVPAIMATRTLESQQDKILTIAMVPFMSCGARLSVYALFTTTFFPHTGQNVVFILYIIGILAAVLTGFLLKKFLFNGNVSPFIMELPDYHIPSPKQALMVTWDHLKRFLLRTGKIIIIVVVILNTLNSLGTDGSFGNQNTQFSVLSKIGQVLTHIFAPMGMTHDNWPAAVGLFTGILAKEAVVGTLHSIYTSIANNEANGMIDEDPPFDLIAGVYSALATIPENLVGLTSVTIEDPWRISFSDFNDLAMMEEIHTNGVMQRFFLSDSAVIAYLLMILLYTPCVSVLGVIFRESGLGWTCFVAVWTFFLGYSVATVYYQLSLITIQPLSTISWLFIITIAMIFFFFCMRRIGQRIALKSVPFAINSSRRSEYH